MVEHDHIGGEKATTDYVLTLKVPLKATGGGGGPRVKKHVGLFSKISWRRVGCKKPHQKILFLTKVINFLKIWECN